MAVAYQSVATAQGSATCNKPSGVASGDLMIAHVAVYDNTGVTVSPPSGWTLLRGPTRNNGFFNMAAYAFYKVAGGSEPSSYTFTPSPSEYIDVAITRWTGHDAADPIDAGHTGATGNSTTRTATGFDVAVAGSMLVMFSIAYTNAASATPPSGMTLATRWSDNIQAISYELRASAGATGNRAHTQANDPESNQWVAQLFAIKPAATAKPRFAAQIIG